MKISELTVKAKIIIAAAAAVTVTAAAVIFVMLSGGKAEAYRVLKIFEMTGGASVDRSAMELSAYTGMNLESSDVLSVMKDSSVFISPDNDKFILLDRNTVMEMKASGTPSDIRTTIKLISGTILNEITNPLSANSVYEVNTPKATMAVRGTDFTVTVTELNDPATCAIIGSRYMDNGGEQRAYGNITIQSGTLKLTRDGDSALIGSGGSFSADELQYNGVITICADAVIEGSGTIGGIDYNGNSIVVSVSANIDSGITFNGNVTYTNL